MFRIGVLFISTICLSIFFISCKKDKWLTDPSAQLSFSQDSVLFDTVFTTLGSTTKHIRVINNNNQKIKISSIHLEKGQASNFFLNVDGVKGKEVKDVEILAKDSIYVFIQVNVNPTNQNSPLVIQDNIVFELNGNEQSVALEAWGQDAYYHLPDRAIQYKNGYLPYSLIAQNTNTTVTWNNDKPHVIYGWLVVDSTQKLVINQGVKLYFHQNAGLWVYRYGTLQVNGTLGNEVIFQGDRREVDYLDVPGQWDRIWINEGHTDNYINYAIVKNSYIGVQAEVLQNLTEPKRLKITNTIIKNCSRWGVYGFGFTIWGANNIISNCKEYCGLFSFGGNYTFLQTTFANYFNKDKGRGGQTCVGINNYITDKDGNIVQYAPLDSACFTNSIVDGSLGNELTIDVKSASAYSKFYKFSHCLLKTSSFTGTMSVNNVFNQSSGFKDVANYDFRINESSKARGIGDPVTVSLYPVLSTDIKGSSRVGVGLSDAGAHQYP